MSLCYLCTIGWSKACLLIYVCVTWFLWGWEFYYIFGSSANHCVWMSLFELSLGRKYRVGLVSFYHTNAHIHNSNLLRNNAMTLYWKSPPPPLPCSSVLLTRSLQLPLVFLISWFLTAAPSSADYCLNMMLGIMLTLSYHIPLSSRLCMHTHMLTSPMWMLILSVFVRVCCKRCWFLPISLVSCCNSSFRSSTEEMGEFLTRSTRDGGSGSP